MRKLSYLTVLVPFVMLISAFPIDGLLTSRCFGKGVETIWLYGLMLRLRDSWEMDRFDRYTISSWRRLVSDFQGTRPESQGFRMTVQLQRARTSFRMSCLNSFECVLSLGG